MKIDDILQKENILLNMEVDTKEEAIEQLSNLLYESNKITDLKQFIEDVYIRESLGFTGAGKGIAIPHGVSEAVKDVAIAIGKVRKEIYWDTWDEIREEDKNVRLIILFAVPNEDDYMENRKHIELLKLVMEKLADNEILQQLILAGNKEEIINILAKKS